jgi:hypothetical protein
MGPIHPTLSLACACAAKIGMSSNAIERTVTIVVVKILFFILISFLVTLSHLKKIKIYLSSNNSCRKKLLPLVYNPTPRHQFFPVITSFF